MKSVLLSLASPMDPLRTHEGTAKDERKRNGLALLFTTPSPSPPPERGPRVEKRVFWSGLVFLSGYLLLLFLQDLFTLFSVLYFINVF